MAEEVAAWQFSQFDIADDEQLVEPHSSTRAKLAPREDPDNDVVVDLTTSGVPDSNAALPAVDRIVIDLTEDEAAPQSDTAIDLATIRQVIPLKVSESPTADSDLFISTDQSARIGSVLTPEIDHPSAGDGEAVGGLATATVVRRATKRALDIAVSALGLVGLLPLMAFIALAIKVTSPGPVVYRSIRVGKDGREFEFLKFRSMYKGAEKDCDTLRRLNEQSGPVFKIAQDPRITSFGRFLRRSSLDELPQLLHVLSGEMSLVGPRPALPTEVAEYDTRARQRLLVKPGITCIWQVSGRSDIDFDMWIDMDIEYIRTWSFGNDLGLLIQTIPAVVGGEGAY